jgi:hypothetical protein
MRTMVRVIATLRRAAIRLMNGGHDRYCPCGSLDAVSDDYDGDTVASKIVVPEHDG